MSITKIIAGIVDREGGYVDHPNDRGGPTNWGITEKVARENGYMGDMKTMPKHVAIQIYENKYVKKPRFDWVENINSAIAEELVDTGVNMGIEWPSLWLQQCLNALNDQGEFYPDIAEDGHIGNQTINALQAYLKQRGSQGTSVMLTALNCLQGARYIELTRRREKNEDFIFGWLRKRIML